MPKIVLIGAGSIIFAKNLVGDCLMTDCLRDSHIALVDIDRTRLQLAHELASNLNLQVNTGRATISSHLDRREALPNADFVIITIQVGGYRRVALDYETAIRHGLQQTYADTLGIGGIFRALRTAPKMLEIAADMEELCPRAWMLTYTNPMAILTGTILKSTPVQCVGLCHSVQVCAQELLQGLDLHYPQVGYTIAGVNHQAWLLEIESGGRDLYPEIKVAASNQPNHPDRVRLKLMEHFGYYTTESSLHAAEYSPYFIKKAYPDLARSYGLKTEMFREWENDQDVYWQDEVQELIQDRQLDHERTQEYASYIMEAMLLNRAIVIGGNVLNQGWIENLPQGACVEIPCTVDSRGITPHRMGRLPPQCAALNRTYLNPVELVTEALLTRKKEHIYHAALMDPHTSAELTIDEIIKLCDDMIESNKGWIPEFL